jgi:serine/threonine-protein kinase
MLAGEAVGATPTVAGSLLGTPGYMSPELVVGKPASVQSDVFALGSLLFELLTLQRMVPGNTVMDILVATRDGFDARPTVRAPDAEVAPELEVVVLKACAPEAEQRYGSVRALHDAIERLLAGERDLELRSEMAKVHAARAGAEVAQMRAQGDATDETRRRALQEVGRSLALEPKNGAAFAALLELLQTPPRETPKEVVETLQRSAEQATRTASLMAAIGFALLTMYLPWMYRMGVRDWPKLAALAALLVVAAGASYLVYRMTHPRPELTVFSVVAFMLIGGVLNTVVLPFILAPPLVTVATLAYMTLLPHKLRVLTLVMASVALLAPLLAWWLGFSGPPLTFVDGSLIITPRLVTFDSFWTIWLIIDSSVVTVALGAWSAVRLRAALERAQEQIAVQAWNLRQLLPPEAGNATLLDNTAADPQCVLEGFFTARGLRQWLPLPEGERVGERAR